MNIKLHLHTFFRTFYIQGTWNYPGMLNFGLLFTLIPFFHSYRKNISLNTFPWNYHSEFFNTHPIFASYIIGALIKMEENRLQDSTLSEKEISYYKARWSQALGAMGDRYFWKYLRPLASLAGATMLLITYPWSKIEITLSLSLFLLIYNIPHLQHRYRGLDIGYNFGKNLGSHMSDIITKYTFPVIICSSLFLIGIILTLYTQYFFQIDNFQGTIFILTFAGSFIVNFRRIVPSFSLFLPIGIGIILVSVGKLIGLL